MNKYLLSDEAIEKIHEEYQQKLYDWQDAYMNGEVGGDWVTTVIKFEKAEREAIVKAAVKHCLEQLEREGRIRHDEYFTPIPETNCECGYYRQEQCFDDCWLCAALREVGA